MAVEVIKEKTPELVSALENLIPQLSRSSPMMTDAELRDFLAQPAVYLFGFRSDRDAIEGESGENPILGLLTLVTFDIPTGRRAWVEDVVVDEAARGQGAGRALVDAALEKALELGVRTVDLTSRPHREAANRLYRRCGFEERETNIYRYQL